MAKIKKINEQPSKATFEFPTVEEFAKQQWQMLLDNAEGLQALGLIEQALYYGWHKEAVEAINDLGEEEAHVWELRMKAAASEELGLRDFERIHDECFND